MTNIKITRALQLKNRLVKELGDARAALTTRHRWVEGTTQIASPAEVVKLLNREEKLLQYLIEVKAALAAKAVAVSPLMRELEELKAKVNWLTTLVLDKAITNEREVVQTAQGLTHTMKERVEISLLPSEIISQLIRAAKNRIDEIQSELDAHNFTETVSVSDEALAALS